MKHQGELTIIIFGVTFEDKASKLEKIGLQSTSTPTIGSNRRQETVSVPYDSLYYQS